MAITSLPTAPQRTDDPAIFVTRADAWVAALNTWTTQANSLATDVNSDASDAAQSVIDAAAQVTLATAQANLASGYKTDAQSAASNAAATANVTKWISGTTYTEGQNVWSPIDFKTYRRKSSGGGTTDPSIDTANWESLITEQDLVLISSATASNSTTIDFTGLDNSYHKYVVEYLNLNGTESASLLCHVQVGGTWQTSNYFGVYIRISGGSVSANGSDNNAIITFSSGTVTTTSYLNGSLQVADIANTSKQKIIEAEYKDTTLNLYKKQYYYNSASAITGLRFVCSAGNIATGTFKLYGLKA